MLGTQAYSLADLQKAKIRIDIKRLIDENNVLKNKDKLVWVNEIYFTLELISHSDMFAPKKYSKIYPEKLQLNQTFIFDWVYEDLTVDSRIAIILWSSAKKLDEKKPLGSTVISLFDENDCLRQGKYHLFIWPDTIPDYQIPTMTPGLTDDPNIETLNFVAGMIEKTKKNESTHDQRTQQALNLKLIYTYKLIPAAFLQIQFPKFPYPVLYQDKIAPDYEDISLQIVNQTDFNDCFSIFDPDYESKRVDPIEETFYFLKREKQVDPEKRLPNREEVRMIDAIVQRTFKADNLKPQEKQLFVKYRYYLKQDKKYLIHFLHSVQWGTHEENEAIKLLETWQRIQWPDALHLLSRQFAANSLYNKKMLRSHQSLIVLRNYAASIIEDLDLQILYSILLQLIQTIRYDAINQSPISKLIIQKALLHQQVAVFAYWYLNTESETTNSASKQKQILHGKTVEAETVKIYRVIFAELKKQLKQKNKETWFKIQQQEKFIKFLRELSKIIKDTSKSQQKNQYHRRLADVNWEEFGPVCFPLDTKLVLKAPVISSCIIFSSAMAPFKLAFQLEGGGVYQFIYKNGDDLRQDQLILEMFGLMDKILKGVNQDYKLTPYKALACSKSDGFVQFVPKTKTFQDVNLNSYIQNLIKQKGEEVMQNYVFSTAGYCAMTYFFIIGDRHLQNLLIDQEGKIFHIDFGFILGRDPKPYPPPIKISKQMFDAMGTTEQEIQDNYKKFKLKCLQAYLYLRKHAKMFYNLSVLMLDSGIKDAHNEGLSKLYDKFSINLNDKQAEKYFFMVLEECKNALFPLITQKIHVWATYFRK